MTNNHWTTPAISATTIVGQLGGIHSKGGNGGPGGGTGSLQIPSGY
jgi:hypothetical protein